MPNLTAVKAKATAFLNLAAKDIGDFQDSHILTSTTHPYWGGLPTHDSPPKHTRTKDGDSDPDRLDRKVNSKTPSWRETGAIKRPLTSWPCSVAVNFYSGPRGIGYTVAGEFTHDSKTYRKVIQFGNETEREQDWTLAQDDI